jgi:hypothetical protein
MRTTTCLRGVLVALGAAFALLPQSASADLTSDLCGKLVPGAESRRSEGRRIRVEIDTVEGRTAPVPHCYVHGTLNGDTRFRILLPQAWNRKLVFGLGGGYGGNEFANDAEVTQVVVAEGYAFAQSNEGRPAPVFGEDDTWRELHYTANHDTTLFAKEQIKRRYGRRPARTYLFGSSGGGWRSLALLERFPKDYDGAGMRNPAIEPRHLTYTFTVIDHFLPVIRAKLPQIIAARDRNETALPFLTPAEQAALDRIYAAGAARGSEFKFTQTADSSVTLGYAAFRLFDPTYFDDFWTTPGYAGYEGEVDAQVVEGVAGTVSTLGAPNAGGYVLSFSDASKALDPGAIKGWRLTVTSGALAGQSFHVASHTANQITIAGYGGALNGLAAGDAYTLSNRDFLAWQHYHEHIAQCEFPEYAGDCDGRVSRRPERPWRVQRAYARHSGELTGRIGKPVVSTAQALDHLVYPPIIARYFDKVRDVLGHKARRRLRVYWNENVTHGNPLPGEANRIVERDSSWHVAFQAMVRWVERGVPPPPDTVVTVTPGSVTFPATAAERRGIQPTVTARANNQARIVVPAGSLVHLDGLAASPVRRIARYDWDFEGDSRYDCSSDVGSGLPACGAAFTPGREVSTPAAFIYLNRGTYTATVRVHDDADNPGPFDGVENLSRVVVVVE